MLWFFKNLFKGINFTLKSGMRPKQQYSSLPCPPPTSKKQVHFWNVTVCRAKCLSWQWHLFLNQKFRKKCKLLYICRKQTWLLNPKPLLQPCTSLGERRQKRKKRRKTTHSSAIGCVLFEPFFSSYSNRLFVWAKIHGLILLTLLMEAAALKPTRYACQKSRIQPLKQSIENVQ